MSNEFANMVKTVSLKSQSVREQHLQIMTRIEAVIVTKQDDPVWNEVGNQIIRDDESNIHAKWFNELRPITTDIAIDLVFLVSDDYNIAYNIKFDFEYEIERRWKSAETALKVKNPAKSVRIYDTLQLRLFLAEHLQKRFFIYSCREDKSENAPAFLKRVYANELAAGTVTLSDLRQRDKSLWAGLRNWASAGKHDLDSIIPRGKTVPGRAREEYAFDPAKLDPTDPVQAAALKLIEVREAARARARKSRQQALSR